MNFKRKPLWPRSSAGGSPLHRLRAGCSHGPSHGADDRCARRGGPRRSGCACAATPAPSAKPPPPAVPACAGAVAAVPETDKYAAVAAVPAVLTNCTPSGGDTAWMLTSVALVLMMTIPGLGLFYGGMVRKKNVGDTVMTSFAITWSGDRGLRHRHLLNGVHLGHPVRRRTEPRIPPGYPQRHQQWRDRQSESAGADDPRDGLHVLPDDLRDHHARAHRRRLCGTHEILGDAVVHGSVGDFRLRPGRPLALGTGRHLQLEQRRGLGQGSSTSPAARSCTSTLASPASSRRSCWASATTQGRVTTWC